MDVDIHVACRSTTPATTVQPWTVVIPGAAAIIAAASHFCDTTAQPKLQAEQDKGAEENFFDVFHGRLTGLALFSYSTRPTVPPVGSSIIAKRLPNAAACGATTP